MWEGVTPLERIHNSFCWSNMSKILCTVWHELLDPATLARGKSVNGKHSALHVCYPDSRGPFVRGDHFDCDQSPPDEERTRNQRASSSRRLIVV